MTIKKPIPLCDMFWGTLSKQENKVNDWNMDLDSGGCVGKPKM